ncbi:MAG: hypothetical protein KR126chlam2_01229 [Chlamydiae bacterium]|nr:hypothetical protein [Chlamydiota bacterium]
MHCLSAAKGQSLINSSQVIPSVLVIGALALMVIGTLGHTLAFPMSATMANFAILIGGAGLPAAVCFFALTEFQEREI